MIMHNIKSLHCSFLSPTIAAMSDETGQLHKYLGLRLDCHGKIKVQVIYI